MRIDIVVIITIVVTHYAEKILDIFDRKVVAVIRKIKTKIKESFKHKKQKADNVMTYINKRHRKQTIY